MYEPNYSHRDPRPQRHRTRTKRKPLKHKRAAASLGGVTLRLVAMQLPATATAHLFPYTPTQILTPSACWNPSTCHGADLAYIFSQTDSGSVQFSALNYSSTLGAEDSQLTTLTAELPFLKDEPPTTAFGAARTSDGTIIVYSGACDGDIGSIWTYSTSPGDPRGGTWTNKTITTTDTASGPAFLGGTIAFSTKLAPSMDQPTLYTYGGMCSPPGPNATAWQTSANYTTKMMSLAPPNASSQLSNQDTAAAAAAYSLRVASTGGPRIPIAGFTLTQLPVSTTNISGSVTQQAGYVLLGGHTQEAFVNMSTAAVWNLPEESWSYVNVAGPADLSSAAEMMVMRGDGDGDGQVRGRAVVQVDSRSGHTAVLAEDGASVVVLGGWVGDVDTPAEPQLVVLRLSQTYSSWRWEVPRAQPGGRGVYGHGAAMLPGNVMMVYGGWETSASGGEMRKAKRQAFGAGGGALRFFNVTSSSWSNSYTNPLSGGAASGGGGGGDGDGDGKGAHEAPPKTSDNDDSERKKRLELGLGLGLGLALLLGVVVAFCLWRARRKRRRGAQDEAIQSMTRDAQYSINNADEMMERDDMYPWHPTSDLSPLGYEALRGARASLDDSGPYRPAAIARKPVPPRNTRAGDEEDEYDGEGRAGYMPDARLNASYSTPGRIHPIMEDDEEDHQDIQTLHRGHHPGEQPLTPISDAQSDPFITPTTTAAPPVVFPPTIITPGGTRRGGPATPNRTSAGPSPEEHRYYDPDVQEWVSDVNAADSLLEQYNSSRKSRGPLSPTRRASVRSTALRDDESRSGSNLSDANRSSADESLRRSASHRRSGVPGGGGGLGLGLLIDHPKPSSSSTSSYNTARTGFATLQAEGPSLLQPSGASQSQQSGPTSLPNPNAPLHGQGGGGGGGLLSRRVEEQEPLHHEEEAPSSPSKSKPRRSWLGSLSRVFSQSGGGSSRRVASATSASERDREADLFRDTDFLGGGGGGGGGGGDYEPRGGELRGELLRRKQGRQDWDWEREGGGERQMQTQAQMAAQRDVSLAAGTGTGAVGESENDWDTEIERAVERRLVQVMFTVPKEKLRVVNGGEEEDLDDGEGGHQQIREPERETLTNRAQVQVQRTDGGIAAAQSAELVDPEVEKGVLSLPGQDEKERGKEKEKDKENKDEKDDKEEERDEDDESSQGRMSHSTDDWDKRSSGAIFVAEAVRFERVRGRVLRMVESIEKEKEKEKEGSSREGSIKSGKSGRSGKSAKSGKGRDG
ncbi:hypothetical protein E4U57_005497 [Claviceps arundinis]|uniref:Galactose oxidase n=1 Tax=Claviceps arundinis TaxID=1623583 RepID=A0ABQ7PHZ3_9HYPO|nr:hypothetical protein E4U57_005497 [Claviceps arundinis]